jgi:hypothetical protein
LTNIYIITQIHRIEVYFVCKAASQESRTMTPWSWAVAKDNRKKLECEKGVLSCSMARRVLHL